MARTKQSAKKSTGGTAKRKLIRPPTRILRSHAYNSHGPSHSPQPTTDIEMADGLDLTAEKESTSNKKGGAGDKKAGATGDKKGDDVSITIALKL
jgi:hypothetical protein